jgi:hypothetical protein
MSIYLHSSLEQLEVGTILRPRENYKQFWGQTDFYEPLEKYRPTSMLAHHESVFFCTKVEDLDNCMEGQYLFEIQPGSRIEKHDMQWSTKISCLLSENASEEMIRQTALNYWNGVASSDPLWEYQTTQATILAVHDYYEYEPTYHSNETNSNQMDSNNNNNNQLDNRVTNVKKLKF